MSRLVYFEIQADDPEATTAFYAAVFGWTAERDPAGNTFGLVQPDPKAA